MTDTALVELAHAAGLATQWKDVFGVFHDVSVDTLRAVLDALDLPADSGAAVADSLARVRRLPATLPPLVTADVGGELRLPARPGRYRLLLEDGRVFEGDAWDAHGGCGLPPILEAGYHRVELAGQETTIAVAPWRAFAALDATGGRKGWGLAVQLYSLRRDGDGGLGDCGGLVDFVSAAARHGADAVAISPVHAQFSADPNRFSPYAPSSRVMLNVLHARIDPGDAGLAPRDLVDWPAVSSARLAAMRAAFERAAGDPALMDAFDAFRQEAGEDLVRHARFEALHAHYFGADPRHWHWRSWAPEHRSPDDPAVASFARAHQNEVAYHEFMQFLADRGLAEAQRAAREAGMPIGLIADLAVGTDSGGSQCWSRQDETLLGLTIGAPPDLLNRSGQNWGLVAFSPRGLAASGFAAYLGMVRAALRHAGGVRIDHAMGLNRLWVVPEGASAADGAYLGFPEADLMRLLRLESVRRRAVILAEDLGTVPDGFSDRLQGAEIEGMRVLWFERDDGRFRPPAHWTPVAAAMTSTHDLSTVAGWWTARDLDWRERLSIAVEDERGQRESDRHLLWEAFVASGAASGAMPSVEDGVAAADAAAAHIGRAACELAILPVEDALALVEQPNLPGTIDEHPNWRRRLPAPAAAVLDEAGVAGRLAALHQARMA